MATIAPSATLPANHVRRDNSAVLAGSPLMIDSLRIKNFRAFADVSLANLGQVNIVVGDNGSGKTSLLEAIALGLGGNAELPIRFRQFRGMGPFLALSRIRSAFEELWKDLFHRFDQGQAIEIVTTGDAESARALKVYYDEVGSTSIPFGEYAGTGTGGEVSSGAIDSSVIVPVVFEWTDAAGAKHQTRPEVSERGLTFPALSVPSKVSYFPPTGVVNNPKEAAAQFSALSVRNEEGRLLKVLRQVYPSIENLSIEYNVGAGMLFCSIAGMPEKVPAALVSGGAHKMLVILLGISAQPRGVVVIDEVENGFYYKAMPRAWEALLAFAMEFETQLFVTTHSKECLQAANGTVKGNEDKFRLLRVEREGDHSVIRKFGGDVFEAAIETETEIR